MCACVCVTTFIALDALAHMPINFIYGQSFSSPCQLTVVRQPKARAPVCVCLQQGTLRGSCWRKADDAARHFKYSPHRANKADYLYLSALHEQGETMLTHTHSEPRPCRTLVLSGTSQLLSKVVDKVEPNLGYVISSTDGEYTILLG